MRLSLSTGIDVAAQVCVAGVGTRPKCLLLHGNPGALGDFRQLVPLLSSTVDLVAIDLPGFGQSARPDANPEALGLERLADHATAVADALAWETVVRGAGAVLRARRLPALSRWVLGRVMRDMFLPEPVPSDRLASELSLFAERPEILVAMVHVALGKPCEKLRETAPHIRCPTLFLHGALDALVPVDRARSIHDLIVNAGGRSRFEILPGAGHMLAEHRPNEVVAQILEHVSRGQAA